MRVLQIGKYFPPYQGGVEIVTEMSARALAGVHEVTVVCHNTDRNTRREIFADYSVVRCGTQVTVMKQPISLSMGWEIRNARPELIHLHAPNFWAAAMILLFAPTTPIIITHHCDVEGRWLARKVLMPLYKQIVRRARSIIVASKKTASWSTDLLANLVTIAEIPLGLDERKFEVTATERVAIAQQKRARYGNQTLFGFVGRLVWYKGLPTLLRAMTKVDGMRLVVVGDGPMKADLVALAKELGVSDRVEFLGHIDDAEKKYWMYAIDALVLPSTHKTEAFGLVQVEAQLCGKAVVTTDLPTGVSDITIDGVTGKIVRAGDIDHLADALQHLVDNPALLQRFGAAGRLRAMQNYTERRYMERLRAEVASVVATVG